LGKIPTRHNFQNSVMSLEAKSLQCTETLQEINCMPDNSKHKQLHAVASSDTNTMAIRATQSRQKRVSCLVLWYPGASQKTQKMFCYRTSTNSWGFPGGLTQQCESFKGALERITNESCIFPTKELQHWVLNAIMKPSAENMVCMTEIYSHMGWQHQQTISQFECMHCGYQISLLFTKFHQ
jgi:hypothetical protein